MRNFYAYFKCIIFYIYISSYIFTYWILLDLNANFICILYSCFTPIGWFSYLEEGSQKPETRNQKPDITKMLFLTEPSLDINWHIVSYHHYTRIDFGLVCVQNVMRLSRLFRGCLFCKHSSRLMIWKCFNIVSNVIRSN